MKTIKIKIYKFDELSEQAKQVAIQTERSEGINTEHIYSEAKNTVDRFCEVFNVQTYHRSWLEFGSVDIEYYDHVMDFKPERLRKYIINNFGYVLFTPKWIGSINSDQRVQHPNVKPKQLNSGKFYNPYYSAILKQSQSCNLTGVCYDESILQPVYEFLNGKNHSLNFEQLLNECFEALSEDIDQEIEAMQEDEYISDNLISNDYDFLESGEMYN